MRRALWMLLATILLAARPAATQETSVVLAAGATSFDLSGTGTAPLLAARLDQALHPDLRLEGAVTVAWPAQQFGRTTTFLAPEVQLQWAPVLLEHESGRWSMEPYLGVGTGWAWDVRPDLKDRTDVSFSGALGARFPVGAANRGGLEAEVRVRFLDPGFVSSSGDFTLGWYWGL